MDDIFTELKLETLAAVFRREIIAPSIVQSMSNEKIERLDVTATGDRVRKLQILIWQTTDFHFANYRFPFRKLQISISQSTDFHFAIYRFPFRKLQISISISFRPISFRKLQ